MSWVASMAAGDRLILPEILSPNPRVMWRLTSALTGLPMVPSATDLAT